MRLQAAGAAQEASGISIARRRTAHSSEHHPREPPRSRRKRQRGEAEGEDDAPVGELLPAAVVVGGRVAVAGVAREESWRRARSFTGRLFVGGGGSG